MANRTVTASLVSLAAVTTAVFLMWWRNSPDGRQESRSGLVKYDAGL
jgi:hypothetical protein